MPIADFYYVVKPFIPRSVQIALRSGAVFLKRSRNKRVWPIDERAGQPPAAWSGWPENKKFALTLTHDVDTAVGHTRCASLANLEESLGFRSSFNFVAEGYSVSSQLRKDLKARGFEVGVHGLHHDRSLFSSKEEFQRQAAQINRYLKEWEAEGFRSPCMYHNLEWMNGLDIKYDASTFDTDPFEPQPDGVQTIFPFWVSMGVDQRGYIELPYTLPQDFTLFILMREKTIDIWKKKLDWVVQHGGVALINTHPDYMRFDKGRLETGEYPVKFYEDFLQYVKTRYEGQYWHALPKDLAGFWSKRYVDKDMNNQHYAGLRKGKNDMSRADLT